VCQSDFPHPSLDFLRVKCGLKLTSPTAAGAAATSRALFGRRDQVELSSPLYNFVSGRTVELAVDRLRVRVDRAVREEEGLRDLAFGQSFGEEL
jgi:hypothetical protein